MFSQFCLRIWNPLKILCFLLPILTYLKKIAFCCELFNCWPQITMISFITVHGHNLKKIYYICRQKELGCARCAVGAYVNCVLTL